MNDLRRTSLCKKAGNDNLGVSVKFSTVVNDDLAIGYQMLPYIDQTYRIGIKHNVSARPPILPVKKVAASD